MGDTQIVVAKLNAMIRRQGAAAIMVKKGRTTAHAGAEIVASHPHLWEPVKVDFPVEGADLTDAAVEAAGTSHTEALRAIAEGMAERGYDLVAESREDVPAQLVALVFSAIDHPRGGTAPAGDADEPPAPVDPDANVGETGGPGVTPADVVDPSTAEGRKEIRHWAGLNGHEVAATGPIPQHVVDAWARAQGGRA